MRPQVLFFVLLLTLIGCQAIEPSHKITSKTHKVNPFEKIRVSGAMKVDISFSSNEEVVIEAPENLHKHINVSVSSGELTLGMKSSTSIYGDSKIKVHIKAPSINSAVVSGASSVKLNENYKGDSFDLNLSGASSFRGKISVSSSSIEMSGAASAEIKGKAAKVKANLSGASNLISHNFTVGALDIDLSGASNAELEVKSSLSVDASGASSFEYKGNPTILKLEESGASSISKN
ncbi:MAG: DUF2807 domain-containing protein [Crocinitomicaceae bacterium]|nr:DUF2807 domain-containing protein [Crocinitomicaceae bacterium]